MKRQSFQYNNKITIDFLSENINFKMKYTTYSKQREKETFPPRIQFYL